MPPWWRKRGREVVPNRMRCGRGGEPAMTILILLLIIRLLKRRLDDESICAKVLEKHPHLSEKELRRAIRTIRRALDEEL